MLRKEISRGTLLHDRRKPSSDSDSACCLECNRSARVHSPLVSKSASPTTFCQPRKSRLKKTSFTSPTYFNKQVKSRRESYDVMRQDITDSLKNDKQTEQREVVYVDMDPGTKLYKFDAEQSTPLISNLGSPASIWRNPYGKSDAQAEQVLIQNLKIPSHKTVTPGVAITRRTSPTRTKLPIFKSDTDPNKDNNMKSPRVPPMDWKVYHRLAVIEGFLDHMETSYPSLCTMAVIGKSVEGRPIKLLKVSDSNANNIAVWIDSGIHAREWIGPAVNTYVANHIVKNFNRLPKHVTNKDWYFVPVINPDGYEHSHTDNRMWRKNKACLNGKCVGVDLNRNFSYGWGGKGSSSEPTHNFYRGKGPFSEPEACAVRDVIANSGITFKVYITLHSYGQVIILPFACEEELCPNYIHLLQGAAVMSKAIYECNGNVYKVGVSKDVMYPACGTSNDWSHGCMRIPYCYLIELRSRKHKFKLPEVEIEETGNEILNCVIALMEHVDKKVNEGNEFVWNDTTTCSCDNA